MIDPFKALEILSAADARRAARRGFLKAAGGGAVLLGGASLLSGCYGDYPDQPAPKKLLRLISRPVIAHNVEGGVIEPNDLAKMLENLNAEDFL